MDHIGMDVHTGESRICLLTEAGWRRLVDAYPIVSIEDGPGESDWSGWQLLTERLGKGISSDPTALSWPAPTPAAAPTPSAGRASRSPSALPSPPGERIKVGADRAHR